MIRKCHPLLCLWKLALYKLFQILMETNEKYVMLYVNVLR